MASGQVLAKLRALYAKADGEVRRWNSLQDQATSLLGTIANIISRLPALESPGNYGTLTAIPGITRKLRCKQLLSLERLVGSLRDCVADMEQPLAALEKISKDAQRLVQQDKRLTPGARAATVGPVPSIDQCLSGLQEIWQMHADEMKLKDVLLSELRYDFSEAEVGELRAAFVAQPNIDRQRVQDLLLVVAATAETRQFF